MTKTFAFRLLPGQDLKKEIQASVIANKIEAGWIATCVGSLTQYNLRFANQKQAVSGNGFFEIVSLTGTVSTSGSHLHISISDEKGITIGGHLMEGNIINTTAEIVLQSSDEFRFTREKDDNTGWKELKVNRQ